MRLILIGDLHFTRMESGTEEMKEASHKAFSILIDSFLNMKGHFHISLGDLTHEGLPEEFSYVNNRISSTDCNFKHVLGNHDTNAIPKAEILAITGQQRYGSIDTDEAMLIFLDSTKEMNKSDWGGEIDAEQLEWLQSRLEQSGEKPVFVFAHHPVYETTARSTEEKLSIHPDIDMKAVLNKKKGLGFYFCGHNHVNSIVRQDGWHYIQSAACLDFPALRIVELKDGQVSMELKRVDEVDLTDYIARFNTEMPGFHVSSDALGEIKDWNMLVDVY
ncbi:3',5'-cyclic AMP phosphodiesterase CpdA [Paenibacillus sp. 1_12]|uniref:metallophosphoesterase family protein n=1 Tax=Paenibacillus sp. 1_12 TaxID=1566278 RepID=UPI0008EACE6A|nr:metallophosphoesterase [Paenibacillus sp. 1_12]SFM30672.1 3',5'-cyclic AMP phosphodiesterase CpdA [Paenibacillus sp. 1_12]